MNTKLQAVCDSLGRPIDLFVTAGQVSDYIGARAMLNGLPNVKWLLGDRGYDADWFREALQDKGICACIPGRKQRKVCGLDVHQHSVREEASLAEVCELVRCANDRTDRHGNAGTPGAETRAGGNIGVGEDGPRRLVENRHQAVTAMPLRRMRPTVAPESSARNAQPISLFVATTLVTFVPDQ